MFQLFSLLAIIISFIFTSYLIANESHDPLLKAATEEVEKSAVKADEGGGQEVKQIVVEQAPVSEDLHKEIHSESKEIEEGLRRSANASDVVGPRPDPEGVPTDIKISMFVFDIPAIDDTKQTFDTDFRIVMRWFDPRLASDKEEIRQIPIEEIWHPLVAIQNLRDFKKMSNDDVVFVDHEGHCINVGRYLAKFTVPLNLKNFPNDKHKLYIQARSFYSPDQVKFTIDEDLTGWSSVLSIPDWSVSGGEAKIDTFFSDTQAREMAQMEFSFKIERFFGFYFWRIIIPLTLIVFMSWGVFWIDPKRLEAMVGLSATSILTLFAFQFAIGALLPKIGYLTRIDKFTMLSSLLIFLALIESLLTAYFGKKDWVEKAIVLDRISRVLFPISFITIIWYAFFW